MPQFDLDSIDRLLTTTKAVRRRLDLTRPVPRDVVTDCIRLGCYAPNASNAQEWFWVVVDDADQRRKVAQIYRDVLVPRVSQMLDAKLAMGEVLGIPSSWFQVALIPVAYTKGDDFAPSPRRPVDEIIIWNRAEGVR